MSWYSDGMPFDEYEGCKDCNFNKKPSEETCDGCTSGDRWNCHYDSLRDYEYDKALEEMERGE